jgi:hypothetical protein
MKKPTTAPLPSWQVLTEQEQALLVAFRAMDERRQIENLDLAESDALEYPRRAAPALRLIAGGAK